jgi:hypothetical protein
VRREGGGREGGREGGRGLYATVCCTKPVLSCPALPCPALPVILVYVDLCSIVGI